MNLKNLLVCLSFILLFSIVFSQQSEIEVVAVKASLQQKNLVVEIIAINPGEREEKITITTKYFDWVDERVEALPREKTKKITYILHSVTSGTVKMSISNGVNKFIEVALTENTAENKELSVKEITAEEYSLPEPESEERESKGNGLKKFNPIEIAIVIVLFFVLAVAAKMLLERGKKQVIIQEMRVERQVKKIQL